MCYSYNEEKKKKEGFGLLESRGDRARCRGSGVSYDMIALSDFCTRAGPCGLRNQLNRPRITGQEFLSIWPGTPSLTTSPTAACRYCSFFFSFNGIPAGDGRAATLVTSLWVNSRQVLSATGGRHTRHVLHLHFVLFGAHQPRRGFPPLTPLFKRDSLHPSP